MNAPWSVMLAGVVAGVCLLGSAGDAQMVPASVEVRVGPNLPRGDFQATGQLGGNGKFSFGGLVLLELHDAFGVYGGWTHDVFRCSPHCRQLGHGDIVSSGPTAGVRLRLPLSLPVRPWAQGGLTYPRVTVDEIAASTQYDRERGFEVGVGLDFRAHDRLAVVPAVRYAQVPARVTVGRTSGMARETELSFGTFELGVRYRLS